MTAAQADLQAGRDALLAGDPHAAIAVLSALVAGLPAEVEPRYWLASAMLTADDPGAAQAMDDARTLHALMAARGFGADTARCREEPAYAGAIATEAYAKNLPAISSVIRGMALQGAGFDAAGLLNYGLALQHQGRVEEASQVFRAAADTFPSASRHQFLLYPQLFCEDGEARYAAEARAWAERYAPAPPPKPFANGPRHGRKLRIGYVAPRFSGSQVRQFIAPVLANHDPEEVEVVLYPAGAETETDWPTGVRVREIGALSDAAAAAMIREDRIDVLADCWGHTAGSRLPLFAHRPAPVQVAWINFVQTTGVPQMDYVLHADLTRPVPTEGLFCERIWPVGPVFNVFEPASGRLDPAPTPALAQGFVTFGSFNHPAKLSDRALDAWATILRGAPTARLVLKYGYFIDPVLQRVTQARFAARGVEPERIVFAGHTTGEAYHRAFREIDLMLDAWPAPGSTTTLEALSNGVPVLALDGEAPTLAGAYARSILEASGLPELVASSPADFVDRALHLAEHIEALDALRARVRPGFDAGGCCDGAAFTRRLEAAFGEMFDRWQGGAA